jgi:hypothetical protein
MGTSSDMYYLDSGVKCPHKPRDPTPYGFNIVDGIQHLTSPGTTHLRIMQPHNNALLVFSIGLMEQIKLQGTALEALACITKPHQGVFLMYSA